MSEDQLEPLITECPNCTTRFRVTESQLEVASGRVRCGACLTVFQGTEHLLWEASPGFETARQAQDALDELLSELDEDDSESSAPQRPSSSAAVRTEPADLRTLGADPPGSDVSPRGTPPAAEWVLEERQLYVGHEDPLVADSETEEAEALADEPADAAETLEQAEEPQKPAADDILLGWEVLGDDAPAASAEDLEDPDEEIALQPPAEQSDSLDQPELLEIVAAAPGDAASEASDDLLEVVDHDETHIAVRSQPVAVPGRERPMPVDVSFAPEPRRWWVTIVMLLALLALGGQIFWYQFDSWGRDPTLRPVYAALCKVMNCELPVLRDLTAMRTEKLLVRSHPDLANALIVDTVIVNEADFAQPFPALELRFTTIDGNLVAGRRFQPDEYLAGELAGATMMAPNTPVRLALEIEDPGGDAVSYFLSFR